MEPGDMYFIKCQYRYAEVYNIFITQRLVEVHNKSKCGQLGASLSDLGSDLHPDLNSDLDSHESLYYLIDILCALYVFLV